MEVFCSLFAGCRPFFQKKLLGYEIPLLVLFLTDFFVLPPFPEDESWHTGDEQGDEDADEDSFVFFDLFLHVADLLPVQDALQRIRFPGLVDGVYGLAVGFP